MANTEQSLAVTTCPWPMSLVAEVRATSRKRLTGRRAMRLPLKGSPQKMSTMPCGPEGDKDRALVSCNVRLPPIADIAMYEGG